MNKQEFLAALQSGLRGLPRGDIQHWVEFYREMVEDRMEDGMSEEEAVAALGPVRDIVAQILSETPLPRLVHEKVKPKRPMKAWEIILLVLGALQLLAKQEESRKFLAIASVAAFICAILLPAMLIGGCTNPEMSCNVLTYPCVYAISVVGIIVQGINAFTKNSQR